MTAAAAADARTTGRRPTTSAAATEVRPAVPSAPPHPTLVGLLHAMYAMYAVVGAVPADPWWTSIRPRGQGEGGG